MLKDAESEYDGLHNRYVCIECLRTFKDAEPHADWICWKCGGLLVCVARGEGVYDGPLV